MAKRVLPKKSGNILITSSMLHKVRDELKHDNVSFRLEMNSKFKDVDARFNKVDARFNNIDATFKSIDARFNEVDARFDKIDARFDRLESKVELVLSAVQRIGLIVEEQNVRNKFVLDGYTNLSDRVEVLEKKVLDS